jgi:uncharacterized protein YaaW (UPF0174 family)
MTPDQRVEIFRSLQIRNFSGATAPLITVALQTAVNTVGFPAYQATAIVSNGMAQSILGHGLGFTTNWMLVKGVSVMAGPLGMAFAALLTANMFAGPAYRVTIPCVVQVAMIRQQLRMERQRRMLCWALGLFVGAAAGLLIYFTFKS